MRSGPGFHINSCVEGKLLSGEEPIPNVPFSSKRMIPLLKDDICKLNLNSELAK